MRWLEESINDFRFALRTLFRAPAFALTVVAALALCIGANTAIFSVVDTVLFRPLSFPDQERLISVTEGIPALGFPIMPFSPPDYLFVAQNNRSFEAAGVYRTDSIEVSGVGQSQRIKIARCTASLFQVLRVAPLVGRTFTSEEDEHAKRVTVLSYGFAQAAFGGPESALGRTIYLNRIPYSVIGVMPASFSFPISGLRFNSDLADLFAPVSWTNDDRKQQVAYFDFSMIARLRPNVAIPQANAEMGALLKQVAADYPPEMKLYVKEHLANFSLEAHTVSLREEYTGNVQRPLILLLAAVGIVLLIGCVDIANLMFSRMVSREREFALKTALGAGSWRLARQMLIEGVVLSVAGGVIGLFLAGQMLPLLLHFAPENLPRLNEVALNWRITVFAVAITLASPLLFCLIPLISTLRSAVVNQLRGTGRTTTQGKSQRLAMSGAVVVQFSLAFLLLTGAGLLVRSFLKATESNPGFRPGHLATVRIALPRTAYNSVQVGNFFDNLFDQLSTLPGVQQTGAVSALPITPVFWRAISIQDSRAGTQRVDIVFCAGNALGALQLPLVRGRLLTPADRFNKAHAAVISESLAKKLWPQENPIGGHVRFGADVSTNDSPWMTVVGVVGDVKERLTTNSVRLILFTTPESGITEMNVLVRASGDPLSLANAIRRQIRQLDANVPVGKIESVNQVLEDSLSAERFRTILLVCFAGAALLLATLGIGGLLAYNTAQRTQEFGVRVALGAERRELWLLVLGHCLKLSGIGMAVGLAASLVLARSLSGLLFDISPYDLTTFLAVPFILALVGVGAGIFAAWRPIHTSPISALRAE